MKILVACEESQAVCLALRGGGMKHGRVTSFRVVEVARNGTSKTTF